MMSGTHDHGHGLHHEGAAHEPPPTLQAAVIVTAIAIAATACALGASWGWGMETPAAVMLGVLVFAAGLWALEPISTVATALIAIAMCVALLGLPAYYGAAWTREGTSTLRSWTPFIAPAGAPVMLLMLGSLTIAAAVSKTGIDRALGERLVRLSAGSASRLVLALMGVSAFLCMWTSNTATGAMMIAVTRPIWSDATRRPRLAAACVMAVCVGANVGGLASPVGAPPSAIAFTALEALGTPVSFVGWLAMGVPLALVLLVVGWVAIRVWMPLDAREAVELAPAPREGPPPARWAVRVTIGVFALTVGLWVTSGWTGLPVEAIALVPLAALPASGVLRARDLARMEWDVMLLILSGLVLGVGLESSGLAAWAVARLPVDAMGLAGLCALVAAVSLVLSAFMSNTATANLLTPIAMAVAASAGASAAPGSEHAEVARVAIPLAVTLAMGSGVSMMLPVASPANAIAHGTGVVTPRQFLLVGTAVALAALAASAALPRVLGWVMG